VGAGRAHRRRQLAAVFGPGAQRPPLRRLWREYRSLARGRPPSPDPATLPAGDGAAVLVIPGFLTADPLTAGLRAFLGACGYHAVGWQLGINWGPTPRLLAGLEGALDRLAGPAGAPVHLIGVSLGGLLARHLAFERPGRGASVAALCSPFNLPTASPLEPFVRLCAARYDPAFDVGGLARPLPVRSLALWSREDGLVTPESCFTAGEPAAEVGGPHLVIGRNPRVRLLLAEHLAHPA